MGGTVIHLEGFGMTGCYLAVRLFHDGVPFTWNDTDERFTAWRASTGSVSPTGHAEDRAATSVWRTHLDEALFGRYMEEADYVFSSKHPPHGGKDPARKLAAHDLRVLDPTSLHLNVQAFVRGTRRFFAGDRVDAAPEGSRVVVAHGFSSRLARYVWGWTVPVRLKTTGIYEQGALPLRSCLYFRSGRFTMAYANPIAGTDLWHAGSSMIGQRVPRELDVDKKYRRWRETLTRLGDGFVVGVVRAGPPVQGWRPMPAPDDTAWIAEKDGRLLVRPLGPSGVRHAPLVYDALRPVTVPEEAAWR